MSFPLCHKLERIRSAWSKPKQPPPAKQLSHKHWSKHPIWPEFPEHFAKSYQTSKVLKVWSLTNISVLGVFSTQKSTFDWALCPFSPPSTLQHLVHTKWKLVESRHLSMMGSCWELSYIWEMPKPHWKHGTCIWLRHWMAIRYETCKHFTWLAPLKLCVNQSVYSNYWKCNFFELHY